MPTQSKKPAEAKDLASVPTPALDSEYERNRLGVLQSYGILDTSRDVGFDEITALAASIFEVPIALISLVDQARQWYKSKVGLDVSETPRAASFCDAAMHGSEVMVVTDATQDPRFMRHPTVTGETAFAFTQARLC
jgi:GAF domain-containing protein